MLLGDGLDGQAQLAADGLAGVPGIGGLKLRGMGDLLLKLFGGQIAAMGVGQGQAVLIHVVAVRALDLGDLVAAAGNQRHHVDPENILHAAAGDGAAGLLGQRIQTVDLLGGGRPGIDGFFAGGDHVDAAGYALFHMLIDIADEAEQCHDGHIRAALIQHLVRIVGDQHARLYAQAGEIAHILTHDGRVHIDRTHDLRAVLIQIAKNVFGHLAAAILYNLNLFHNACSSFCLGRPYGPHHLIMVL